MFTTINISLVLKLRHDGAAVRRLGPAGIERSVDRGRAGAILIDIEYDDDDDDDDNDDDDDDNDDDDEDDDADDDDD